MATAFDLVSEEEKQADWGGMYSIYSATGGAGTSSSGIRGDFAEKAAQIGAIELELAATAAYLRNVEHSKHPWDETKRLKPEKASEPHLERAKKAYRSLLKLPVPTKLPEI
jgi:uncharacterized protein